MKIEQGVATIVKPLEGTQKKVSVETLAKADDKGSEQAYSVEISSDAGQTMGAAQDEEEARRAKVAAIRDQLASGSYNISGKDVASKILGALKG